MLFGISVLCRIGIAHYVVYYMYRNVSLAIFFTSAGEERADFSAIDYS